MASVYDISILSKEIWIIFDLIAITSLWISNRTDDNNETLIVVKVVIFLICFNLFGPFLYNGEILPLVEYWPYAKINFFIGGITLWTAMRY